MVWKVWWLKTARKYKPTGQTVRGRTWRCWKDNSKVDTAIKMPNSLRQEEEEEEEEPMQCSITDCMNNK
jgi:hypothetical protein